MDEIQIATGSNSLRDAYTTLSRPATAVIMRMLNKVTPKYSRYGKPPTKFQAQDLQILMHKCNKASKKQIITQKALAKAFSSWGEELTSPETSLMVKQFVDLLDCMGATAISQGDRLNSLKVHLSAVASRECRQQALMRKHSMLQRKLERSALKQGPHAEPSMLILDEIEESAYNLKLMEQQLVRTASVSLHQGFAEYLNWVQDSNTAINRAANNFASIIRDNEPSSGRRADRISDPPSGFRALGSLNELGTGPISFCGTTDSRVNLGFKEYLEYRNEVKGTVKGITEGISNLPIEEMKQIPATLPDADKTLDTIDIKREPIYDLRHFERNLEGWC